MVSYHINFLKPPWSLSHPCQHNDCRAHRQLWPSRHCQKTVGGSAWQPSELVSRAPSRTCATGRATARHDANTRALCHNSDTDFLLALKMTNDKDVHQELVFFACTVRGTSSTRSTVSSHQHTDSTQNWTFAESVTCIDQNTWRATSSTKLTCQALPSLVRCQSDCKARLNV